MLAKGISRSEVARQFGVNVSSPTLKRLAKIIPSPEELDFYRNSRRNLLEATEGRLLDSLNDQGCVEKASLNNRAYAFQQVHNARRLEEGKSTGNVSYAVLVTEEARLLAQVREMKRISETSTSQLQVPETIEHIGSGIPSAMNERSFSELEPEPAGGEGRGQVAQAIRADIIDDSREM